MQDESLIKSNFVGRDGFRWWIGQIPPEKSHSTQIDGGGWGNRYKVRIMGYHPHNPEYLPNKDLPWAQVLLPTTAGTGAGNFASDIKLSPGDTVFGFFMDGDNAQIPVILGTFGRTSKVSVKDYKNPFIPFTGYTSKIKNDGKNVVKDQTNEQNANSQKSPRHVSTEQAKSLGKDERSYFTGIGDILIAPTEDTSKTLDKIGAEITNFLNAVKGGLNKLSSLVNIVTDKIQSVTTGLIGSMISKVYNTLAPIINQGLKALYQQVYNLVFAATRSHPIAHLAGVAAQNAMVGPVNNIQQLLPSLANKVINSLGSVISSLLKSVAKNSKRFKSCASNQFSGSLINHIIKQIDSGMSGVLGGIGKILSLVGGFDVTNFLRNSIESISGIVANVSKINNSLLKRNFEVKVNEWMIGRGSKDAPGPDFKDIMKSVNADNLIEAFGNKKKDLETAAKDIGTAFDGFMKTSKSSSSKCYTGTPTSCNPPKIKIFGSKGKGAKAVPIIGAVVGEGGKRTGSVIGIKVTEKGKKYDFPPFIEISDDCDQGYGAVARAIINDDGELESIYMVSEGENYPVGELDPYYVEDIDIIDSGQDYSPGDYAIDQFDNKYELIIVDGIITDAAPINIITIIDPISNVPVVPTNPPRNNRELDNKTERKIEQIIRVDDIPELTIVSETGFGAILSPRLDIIPSKVDESGNYIIKPVTQIDCIS
jgi:hypothetical protein